MKERSKWEKLWGQGQCLVMGENKEWGIGSGIVFGTDDGQQEQM